MSVDERIVTGLPYDINLMVERIQNEGAIVDVSKINFPNITSLDQQIRTTLIYLRNTNFPHTELDFSKVASQDMIQWMVGYITSDIFYNVSELNEMWLYAIGYFLTGKNYSDNISSETFDALINNNRPLIEDLVNFYNSLLLYSLKRLSDSEMIDFTTVKHQQNQLFGDNAYNILHMSNAFDVIDLIDREPIFFDSLFTDTNNQLFDIINNHTPYTAILYGMMNDTDNFKQAVDSITEINATH